jgi:hypothetical protein
VYALFFADIVTTNALQLLDIFGHINKHILAPRAATQDAMNLLFQGSPYELAERYTDMTKVIYFELSFFSIASLLIDSVSCTFRSCSYACGIAASFQLHFFFVSFRLESSTMLIDSV